jgi:hypothetical protein
MLNARNHLEQQKFSFKLQYRLFCMNMLRIKIEIQVLLKGNWRRRINEE